MLILLIGPKGSGKSYIGRVLEARLGVHFFHVEPLWMAYHAECTDADKPVDIAEGVARVHPRIAEALTRHEHVCVETTGASPEILDDLLRLGDEHGVLRVKVSVPLEVCLERIRRRNPTHQIPMEEAMIRRVYELAESLKMPFELVIENLDLPDDEIVERFRSAGFVRSLDPMSPEAQAFIDRLGLEPHPEGGWFREIYRADQDVIRPDGETRSASTLIHFLLAKGDVSRWHVVSSDEVWHFYEGSPLELLVYDPKTETLETVRLGPLDVEGCTRHHVVPRGHWQAARSLGDFTLVGCSVAPGFSFDDFRFVADLPDHDAHFQGALEDFSSLL